MNYEWLVKKLSSVFGQGCIFSKEGDYGNEFAVAYIKGDKRVAVRVEFIQEIVPIEFADVEQEDGSKIYQAVRWKHRKYSLNKDPNKEKIVGDLIEEWRSL